jgi:hypothetical protein
MADQSSSKGWYRYQLLFGATRNGSNFEFEICLQRRGTKGLEDFSREEAERILRQIGNYMANGADFKTLKEDF